VSRLWDLVIGGGIVVCLLALVACAVHMVLEVLAVEASRRKDAGGGQSAGARPDAAVAAAAAPSPGVDAFFDAEAQARWREVAASDAAARVVAELEGWT